MTNNNILSISDVSKMFDVDERRVLGWINSGKLKAEKVDGVYQIMEKELRRSVKKYLFKAWSAGKTHQQVLNLAKKIELGRALDLGAGPGAMSNDLKNIGFDVTACDLMPEIFCLDDIKCDKVDINNGLSIYDSNSFDLVTCLDVIEHIKNQFFLISEVNRILKQGGHAIFTSPNIEHLQSRIWFLFTGTFSGFIKGDYALGHINPLYPLSFYEMLKDNGFKIISDTYNRGWLSFLPKNTHMKENGFEVPFSNKLFGQAKITFVEKL